MSHRPWTGELKAVRNHAPGCPWLLVDGDDRVRAESNSKELLDALALLANKGGMVEGLVEALRKLRDVEAPVCTCWRVPEDGPGWCSHCHASKALAAYDALGQEGKPG